MRNVYERNRRHDFLKATEKAATCTETETITEEKQNTLLQQLVESLDDSEGNLLVKFMSMLQNKGNVELQSSDAKKTLPSSCAGDTEERKSAAMKNINTDSSLGEKGISANLLKPAQAEIFEDRHKFLVESSQKDRTLSSRGVTIDSDMDNTPDEIEHSSSGDCGAELMSSSDDDMDEVSVEPGAVGDVHDAADTIVSKSNCSLNKIKQVTSIGKVAPEMVKANENIMNTFPNSKSLECLGSSYGCPVSSDDQFGSVITDQKNVQSSPEQISNVLSSKQTNAHFRPLWKNLDSSAQRSSSGVQFNKDPSGGYKPTGKLQFGLGSIHNASLSENTKYLLTFQQEGKDVPNTRQRLSGHVGAPLQKARTVSSTLPENTFDFEYSHNKQLSHIDSIIMDAANWSHFKGKAVVQGPTPTPTQHKPHDISKETPICCDRKDEPIGLNADKRRRSVLSGSCTKEDVTTQSAYQKRCIPDMKLYHKVHLIEENELVPYTEILPKEIWTTDDIGLVRVPQEFIDEIDLW
nr:uncharacterized protein LOC129253628 [Lytechinus pictus]